MMKTFLRHAADGALFKIYILFNMKLPTNPQIIDDDLFVPRPAVRKKEKSISHAIYVRIVQGFALLIDNVNVWDRSQLTATSL